MAYSPRDVIVTSHQYISQKQLYVNFMLKCEEEKLSLIYIGMFVLLIHASIGCSFIVYKCFVNLRHLNQKVSEKAKWQSLRLYQSLYVEYKEL